MKIILWRWLLAMGVVCLPVTCMNGLLVIGMFNPMPRAFLTSFTVVNQSQETIDVTPIGTIGTEGRRRILPLSSQDKRSLNLTGPFEIRLHPKGEHQFTYDWDDINFSELAVRDGRGEWYQLVTDPNPAKNENSPPKKKSFAIPPLSQLSKATNDVIAAAKSPRGQSSGWWTAFHLMGILGPLLVFTAGSHLKKRPAQLPGEPELNTAAQR